MAYKFNGLSSSGSKSEDAIIFNSSISHYHNFIVFISEGYCSESIVVTIQL